MTRVQQATRCVQRLQQVRARSTAAVAQDAAAGAEAGTAYELAKPYKDIPGPKPLPVIGNVWRFMPVIGKYHKMKFDRLIQSLHAEYGPVCQLRGMPGHDTVFLADPSESQKVYRNEGPWPSRRFTAIFEHYYRDIRKSKLTSLVTAQGKEWKDFRSAVNQVMMQPRNVQQYLEPIGDVTQEFIERMRLIRTADGRMPADFANELAKWTLESISYLALDTRLGMLEENLDPASETVVLMNLIWGLFDSIYDLDIKPSLWKWVPTPTYLKFVRDMNHFTEIASRYVEEAATRLKTMSREELEKGNRSILESLLLNTDDPSRAVSMALDMILAGVDGTSAVSSLIFYQLAINPDKQAKLHEELDRVIPDRNKTITQEQIEQLKYMRACIKEATRIMPAFACGFRDTGTDMVLGGYQVPKGIQTGYSTAVIYHSEKYYPKADQFIPERWLADGPADLKLTHPFAYLPFGFGPRMCVGRRIANMELEIIVSKVFRNFTLGWDLPPAECDVRITRKIETPLQFTVKDRQ